MIYKPRLDDNFLTQDSQNIVKPALRRHYFTSTQVFVLTFLIQTGFFRHPKSAKILLRIKIHTHPLGDTV